MSSTKNYSTQPTNQTNLFQACSQLAINPVYQELRNEGKCGLEAIMQLQSTIQTEVYGYDFAALQSNNQLLSTFYDWNDRALDSEKEELLASLGGMSTGNGNGAFWKPWKKNHSVVMGLSWNDLSMEDKFEAWFEWIDALHFLFNKAIAIGMTPQIVVDFYYAKNKENINRQLNGY